MDIKKILAKFIFYLTTITQNELFEKEKYEMDKGAMDKIIRDLLENFRPSLKEIWIDHQDFKTGAQEFGNLKGKIDEFVVKGLDTFNISILKTSLLDVNNLTISVDKFTIKGFYAVKGLLAFPLGKKDINFFGNGHMSGEFSNLSFSLSLKIRYENGMKFVKTLNIITELEELKVHLTNLMGGGELEKVFNDLINDVSLTVINYYKQPVLDNVKSALIKQINEMLNQNLHNKGKEELCLDVMDKCIKLLL